jgi:peptidyl-prolyl cis-trans isomerase A (cyclophilin A)
MNRIERISSILLFTAAILACKSENGSAEPTTKPNTAALKDPSKATEKAPDKFTVKLATTAGDIFIDVDKSWAPIGADRIYNLVRAGYYDDVAFFRVISGFMAQVGINGDPAVNKVWREAQIKDDPAGKQSNTRGMVSFATAGPNTRTTQFFINFGNNARLDGMGFAPFGKVRNMDVVDKLNAKYGEGAPQGRGPSQGRVQGEGNAYLKKEFADLTWITKATIETK